MYAHPFSPFPLYTPSPSIPLAILPPPPLATLPPPPPYYPPKTLQPSCFGSFPSQIPITLAWPNPFATPNGFTQSQTILNTSHLTTSHTLSTHTPTPTTIAPLPPPIKEVVIARGKSSARVGKGSKSTIFHVGAKRFALTFDGSCTTPYHIMERRGRFFGSLWLGLDGLKWLLAEWAFLRLSPELKGFFRFFRTGYNILELSCLQNHYGRFVELAEYHEEAQRGGIRVPEGYQGKGWARFQDELDSFFLGKAAPMTKGIGNFHNDKGHQIRKESVLCNILVK